MKSEVSFKNVLVAVLVIVIIFLSSIDSFAVDGVVPLIQAYFNISGTETATIRTASSALHTASLALMWILGDTFDKRNAYLISVALWIVVSLLSIVLGSQSFMILVAFRSLGAGASAVFGVLTPVIMADLFRDRALGIALMFMTVCEMLAGATISIIFASFVVSSGLPWQTGLLIGPLLSLIPLIVLICCMRKADRNNIRKRNIFAGAFRVFSIKSFNILTIALSLGSFHNRALMFWMPSMILSAWTYAPEAFLGLSYPSVMTLNSFLMLGGTVLGMPLVLWFAQSWHHGSGLFYGRSGFANAFPIVVGIGGILSSVMFTVRVLIIDKSYTASLIPNFLIGVCTSAEVGLSELMLLMILPKSSRGAAIALSRLMAGVVGTPAAQFVGFLSDTFRGDSTLEEVKFHAFQRAMLISNVFWIASALFFLIMIAFFKKDCKIAEEEDKEAENETTSLINPSENRSESLMHAVIRSRAPTVEIFE